MNMLKLRFVWTRATIAGLTLVGLVASAATAQSDAKTPAKREFRRLLGPDSKKIRREGNRTFVWAGGGDPSSAEAMWFDFSGSSIQPEQLQYGIGKDGIKAIDDPVYVKPDDPRLLDNIPVSHYRKDEKPTTNDEIMVTGYAVGSEARAFPTALLDEHELLNDRIGGKPVTVGW